MKTIFVAITGGPSGGKTTLIETLRKTFGQKVAIVPEAATILYRGGFPRAKTSSGQVHAQRAIYATQKELEELAVDEEGSSRMIICDRGSLDGIAYWPEVREDFFESLGTDEGTEMNRYDWVLHLDTADQDFYDSHNPIRTETHKEALKLNEKIKKAWQSHPQRFVIHSKQDFFSKIKISSNILEQILKGESFAKINASLHQ